MNNTQTITLIQLVGIQGKALSMVKECLAKGELNPAAIHEAELDLCECQRMLMDLQKEYPDYFSIWNI